MSKRAELGELLRRLSDGDLSPEDAARLNELLHGDPVACERYLDHLTLEAHLRTEFGGQRLDPAALPEFVRNAAAPPAPAQRVPLAAARWLPYVTAAAVGALLLLAGLLTWQALHDPAAPSVAAETPQRLDPASVATLLFADDCQWAEQEKFVEGQRLAVRPLKLQRGLAVLRFDGGAAVVLQGPTDLDLLSRVSTRLTSGRLTVRAPEEAAGFTVRTPASDVVDLGTEFCVAVERNGATELQVLEGEVAYGKPESPDDSVQLLRAGQGVRYDLPRQPSPRAVPVNAPRFAELLSQARTSPREDLLLVHEPFHYPLGRVPLAEANGGLGWGGPWRLSPGAKLNGAAPDLTIVEAKLKINWPVRGGRGPMLEAPADYQSRSRPLAEPIRLDQDGVYYISVLTRWDAPAPAPNQPVPAIRMVLRSSSNFNGDRVMFNLPHFLRPQLDLRNGAIFTSPQTVAANETQFWVGKIVARRQGEDEIFFRVYGEGEALDSIEPADWNVQSTGIQSDAQLDLLLLTKFAGGTCYWDEVRIGKSWRAVVPTEKAQ
ncbi:MAG: FecR domain-containing protein [Planctomycetia bacterium]|nr:FecR domain-containing protein [Planctomycetia bacterium]